MDELEYEWLWTSDHLLSSSAESAPYHEAWQILGAWGVLTRRVRIGPLVSPVALRHPAVVAKMVSTLDHISGGRAILGLGAGWLEREHTSYGIPFGTVRERSEKLEESAAIARVLLDRPTATLKGKHYRLTNAVAEPKPVQARLPLMVGGSGERRTLRVVARYADMWNGFGTPEEMSRKLEVLRARCTEVDRDPATILATVAVRPLIVRERKSDIDAQLESVKARNKLAKVDLENPVMGTADEVAARLADYARVGLRGAIVQMRTPYDRETIESLAREVRPRLRRLLS